MRFVIQRVLNGKVTVKDTRVVYGKISKGLIVFVGLTHEDIEEYMDHAIDKILNLRLLDDEKGERWKEWVKSLGLEVLLVSQFTLYLILKGNKPDFHSAMDNEPAHNMFDKFVEKFRKKYVTEKVQTGAFGEHMIINLSLDWPVTIEWDYPNENLMEADNKKK